MSPIFEKGYIMWIVNVHLCPCIYVYTLEEKEGHKKHQTGNNYYMVKLQMIFTLFFNALLSFPNQKYIPNTINNFKIKAPHISKYCC